MISTPPRLRADLELIKGMDGLSMIFDPVTGIYHRLSRSAEVIVGLLDGVRTPAALAQELAGGDRERAHVMSEKVEDFVARLERSSLLVSSAPPRATRNRRLSWSRLMPRIVLTRSLPRALEPLAGRLRDLPLNVLGWLAFGGAVIGFGVGAVTLVRLGGMQTLVQLSGVHLGVGARRAGGVSTALAIAIVIRLLLIAVHETAHALVAQVYRVPVRGLGVALLFYCLPVAYVDRSDAYRLSARSPRVALALAGIVSDGLFCGITAGVVVLFHGFPATVATLLLGLQLAGLVTHLNPLMPGDGYTVLETLTGLIDLRGRSLTMLRSVLLHRALPPHLAFRSRSARLGYLAYGVVCGGYVCVVALAFVSGLNASIGVQLARRPG